MRLPLAAGLAVALTVAGAVPAPGQDSDREADVWDLQGLRSCFCVQLLLDPTSEILRDLPDGFRPTPASAVKNLHVSIRGVIDGQPEFATWSPSRLCFNTVDTVRTRREIVTNRSDQPPELFALWMVMATGPSGGPAEVALELFSNSSRLIRSARLAGQVVREARLTIGKVPAEDEDGLSSSDDRFQVKIEKTTVIWDGRLAADRSAVPEPLRTAWTTFGAHGKAATGALTLTPASSHPMVGALKVDGKDEFAKALRASPTRFAGPAYRGGRGRVTFTR